MSKFLASGGETSLIPPVEKTMLSHPEVRKNLNPHLAKPPSEVGENLRSPKLGEGVEDSM